MPLDTTAIVAAQDAARQTITDLTAQRDALQAQLDTLTADAQATLDAVATDLQTTIAKATPAVAMPVVTVGP